MEWWGELTQWLDKPASNATVLVVALLFRGSVRKISSAIDGRLAYLGSVLEAIANKKPWPF
jgi:hypothetical protein